MERNNVNRTEVNDDENDSSTEVQNSRTGQEGSTEDLTQQLNPSNIGNSDILQLLRPSAPTLQLGANLASLQPRGLNQQLVIDAIFPSIAASRAPQLDRIQQLLSLQRHPILASAQGPASALSNISLGQSSEQPLWPSSVLAQLTAERQTQFQQGNNLLNSLTSNMGNAVGSVPSGSRAGALSGNLQAARQNHGPIVMYMDCDEDSLSQYQCLLRKQIELFEADFDDVQWNAQGRNKVIVQGQVGIRCRHCTRLESWERARGAVYYSATLDGLYQAAQNMAKNHLCKHCKLIPLSTKAQLLELRDSKRRASGGKNYWADSAHVLGVYETQNGLRFRHPRMNQNLPGAIASSAQRQGGTGGK